MAENKAVAENLQKLTDPNFATLVYSFLPSSSVPRHVNTSMLHLPIYTILILLAYESPTYLIGFVCEWPEHRTWMFIISIFLAPNTK